MPRLARLASFVALVMAAAVVIPAQQALAFTDVPTSYWDYSQITDVTPWMSDYGSSTFQPTTVEQRNYLARSLVQLFAPTEPIDPTITFPDLPTTDPFYKYANVATKLNWLPKFGDGTWRPTTFSRKRSFDQAIVLALKLQSAVKGLQNIKMANGTKYVVDAHMPYMDLAAWLGLHYNHSDTSTDSEAKDLQADTKMKRDEVAYTLSTARHLPSWEVSNATTEFSTVTLPTLNPGNAGQLAQQQLTLYALQQVGYPYIWAGEWNKASPTGYCCGSQPQGGFDCSGFTWWVLKKYEDGYNAAQYHSTYAGWSLHDRSSMYMAENTPTQLTYSQLQIGNLMFFASDGGTTWQHVDHVGIYIGNGWMMHSTGGGPQLETVASGWYHDHFVYGRRLTSTSSLAPAQQDRFASGDGVRDGAARDATR